MGVTSPSVAPSSNEFHIRVYYWSGCTSHGATAGVPMTGPCHPGAHEMGARPVTSVANSTLGRSDCIEACSYESTKSGRNPKEKKIGKGGVERNATS